MGSSTAEASKLETAGTWRKLRRPFLLPVVLAVFAGGYAHQEGPRTRTSKPPLHQALQELGIDSTQGAAAGFVPDEVCASCHEEISRDYQTVGMSRSFSAPDPSKSIEDFGAKPFFHRPSSRYYRIHWKNGRLRFNQWQLDFKGDKVNEFEIGVDWILGSGTRSRTYLYQTRDGALFQLPLAWYTQSGSWGMAPGFDRPDHLGVNRPVRRECMFCHNAFPDVASGSDARSQPQTFPRQLPQGIGCQRCHGPGGEHVRQALEGAEEPAIRKAITNPAKLDAARRGDVCLQCHLQPSVALPRPRRFGVGDYSFRPGQALTDYLIPVDVQIEGRRLADRFEINHHPYRLRQSRCFIESGGKLECLNCHDPHRKLPYKRAAGRYRSVCLGCHPDATGPSHPKVETRPVGLSYWGLDEDASLDGECVVCHMPKRRPQDVVEVVMTDHWITRRMATPEMLERSAEADPVLLDVALLDPSRSPSGALGKLYAASAVCEIACPPQATDFLKSTLLQSGSLEAEPWLILAEAQLKLGRYAEAETTLKAVLARDPDQSAARDSLALALAGQGRLEESVDLLRSSLKKYGDRAETLFNLGGILLGLGRHREALEPLSKATRLRPTLERAWFRLGELHANLDQPEQAVECYKKVLALDARKTEAYLGLGKALLKLGNRDQAIRYWRQGLRSAPDTGPLSEALRELFGRRQP